jgi:hypothetical protein
MTTLLVSEETVARVRKGMDLIVAHYGEVGLARMDLETLDVAQSFDCPAAQASGRDFGVAVVTMLGTRTKPRDWWEHGFLTGGMSPLDFATKRAQINQAWRDEIQARRAITQELAN